MLEHPLPGCLELLFERRLRLSPDGEVALEDYARVLARARQAEAIPDRDDPAATAGVHLCDPESPPGDGQRRDVELFARELALPADGGGLGWS